MSQQYEKRVNNLSGFDAKVRTLYRFISYLLRSVSTVDVNLKCNSAKYTGRIPINGTELLIWLFILPQWKFDKNRKQVKVLNIWTKMANSVKWF